MTSHAHDEPGSRAPRVSVVIPAYNEEQRIAATLMSLEKYFAEQNYEAEIVVVDDGSGDRTAQVVAEVSPQTKLCSYPQNQGKGYALKLGMNEASGDFRIIYDADASTPISEIEKLWAEFEKGADIVIGSRALAQSEIEIHQPWYRENMGKIFNILLRILRLTSFPDTQCGFKGFTAKSCSVILPKQTRNGYGADCELLYIARVHGLRIAQVPIRWINSDDSRVHPILDSLDMIREVLIVRFNSFMGRYK